MGVQGLWGSAPWVWEGFVGTVERAVSEGRGRWSCCWADRETCRVMLWWEGVCCRVGNRWGVKRRHNKVMRSRM